MNREVHWVSPWMYIVGGFIGGVVLGLTILRPYIHELWRWLGLL